MNAEQPSSPAQVRRLVGLRFYTTNSEPIEFLGITHDSGKVIEQDAQYNLTIRLFMGATPAADVIVPFPDGLDQERWIFYIPGHESFN